MKSNLIALSFVLILLFLTSYFDGKISPSFKKLNLPTYMLSQTPTPSPIEKITDSPTVRPVYKGLTPTSIPWGQEFKIDEYTSASYFGPDDHMSTADELFNAMNIYRSAHNLPTLSKNDTLCSIAQNRANQQKEFGYLSHDGFQEAGKSQNEFSDMTEVLFGGVQPVSGIHIIEWGWDKSLTGHHEAISNPKWHEGCGGIAGYYAVFIFGSR